MTVSSWIKIDEMNSDITLLERPNSYKIGICADISSLCANRN